MFQATDAQGGGPVQGTGEGPYSEVKNMGENNLRRRHCVFGGIAWTVAENGSRESRP